MRPIITLGLMSELTTWIKKISPSKPRKTKSRIPIEALGNRFQAANASRAATIVQKALLQRVLMTIERAFAPVNRKKSDRHARVAFEYLSDPSIFDEVAKAGSRKHLEQACATWRTYDQDARRRRLQHYRDKVVAHAGERDPTIPVPLVSELRNYAMGTADALARLARGSGVVELGLQTAAYDESAKAFWRVWRNQNKSR